MDEYRTFSKQLDKKLRDMGDDIDRLKQEAANASDEAKQSLDQKVSELEDQRKKLAEKITSWGTHGRVAWADFKMEASKEWTELKNGFEKAKIQIEKSLD